MSEELKKLRIGKKYRVKSFEQLKKEYGVTEGGMPNIFFGFNSDMERLCGHIVTITRHKSECIPSYYVKEDPWGWAWTSQMLMELPLRALINRRKNE